MEPLAERPLGGAGRRRPTCSAALAQQLPRQRAENVLDLAPLPLPATTRPYTPPPRPPPHAPHAPHQLATAAIQRAITAKVRSALIKCLDT